MQTPVDRKQSQRLPLSAQIRGSSTATFQLCGYTGFSLSLLLCFWLVRHLALSRLTLLGITGTVIITFYVLMMVTKALADGEVIIYYHHEIAVIATSALFLRLTGQPILPYLDVLVLGLGLFLAFGRIGCFMVGCCHGRPCRWGIRYGRDHADAGFPRYLVGVKLFPIQTVESLFAFCLVAFGLFMILNPHAPGSVLLFYVVAYGCGRFCLEFFRGDADRRYLFGFSEAQWTSCILALGALFAARAGLLPRSLWHEAATIAIVTCLVLVSVRRRLDQSRRFEFLHPAHVRELRLALTHLEIISHARTAADSRGWLQPIHVVHTSAGYRISGSVQAIGLHAVEHFSISREGGELSERTARLFSQLLNRLHDDTDSYRLIQGGSGVFHIVFAAHKSASIIRGKRRRNDLPSGLNSGAVALD
jgi:prolipoprotein diacylglyceryl transferase